MVLICTAYITLKNGRRIYARDYGLKAFCFYVSYEKYVQYMKRKATQRKSEEE